MSKMKITGSFVALITPFNKDGSPDYAAFRAKTEPVYASLTGDTKKIVEEIRKSEK